MILVDTSVWVDHFRSAESRLAFLLREDRVLVHPFVLGELACGSMRQRDAALAYLKKLPCVVQATNDEALTLLQTRKLWGKGLGWIDAHLLASALLSRCELWTMDKSMFAACAALGVAARPPRKQS